jgi:hypothetical protein
MTRWMLHMLSLIGLSDRRSVMRRDPDKKMLMDRQWRVAQVIARSTGESPRMVLRDAYRRADEVLARR